MNYETAESISIWDGVQPAKFSTSILQVSAFDENV